MNSPSGVGLGEGDHPVLLHPGASGRWSLTGPCRGGRIELPASTRLLMGGAVLMVKCFISFLRFLLPEFREFR